MGDTHNIFIPGRLCVGGEHSDWACHHHSIAGSALVVTLQQGLHAEATSTNDCLQLQSELAGAVSLPLDNLLEHATTSSPWRYAAAVAHVLHRRFMLPGAIRLDITSASLPARAGLSSSAALCVLVARAYNCVYRLRLSVPGEMEIAYVGERLTASLCGRMDQIVAIGPARCAQMHFEKGHVTHVVLPSPPVPLFIIVAQLRTGKDTTRILADLQAAFDDKSSPHGQRLRYALGDGNLKIVKEMQSALVDGNAQRLGACMTRAQQLFDEAAIPCCPEQLTSPMLHNILQDSDVALHTYGGKGVGSQGDGSVQFIAKDRASADALVETLQGKLGSEPCMITLGDEGDRTDLQTRSPAKRAQYSDCSKVRTAVIPTAGFGTRLFPASKSIRPKALFPVVDKDGYAKPLLLCLVEECADAGIERVIIVVGKGEQEENVRNVFAPVSKELYGALKPHMREYADRIAKLERLIEIAVQAEPNGFGDAVACAQIADDTPFVLLLGDVLFRSRDVHKSCLQQMMEAFECDPSVSAIGVVRVPLSDASQYGVVKTCEDLNEGGQSASIERIIEKPDRHEAEVCSRNGFCNIVLGPYLFTPRLMTELRKDVKAGKRELGEIQLTSAMISLRDIQGMRAVRLNGEALDTGIATEYVRTIARLAS